MNNCRVRTCQEFGTVKKEYKTSPRQQFRFIGFRQTSVKLAHLLVCLNIKAITITTLLIGNESNDG